VVPGVGNIVDQDPAVIEELHHPRPRLDLSWPALDRRVLHRDRAVDAPDEEIDGLLVALERVGDQWCFHRAGPAQLGIELSNHEACQRLALVHVDLRLPGVGHGTVALPLTRTAIVPRGIAKTQKSTRDRRYISQSVSL